MKLTDRGSARFEEGRIRISLVFKAGDGKVRVHWFATELGFPQWELQNNQPIRIEELCGESDSEWWLFRETLVLIERGSLESSEERKTHVKHFVYRKAKRLSDIRNQVERFERFEKIKPTLREQIPEEVRMYVWRRDGGRCVQCNSDINIEFDHIIPIAKGGSSTERNIQLLCSECNRRKSDII